MKTIKIYTAFSAVALACFALLPDARAVSPPPDGGYPGFTTAEGTNALKNLTTGVGNTAAGWYSLFTNSTGSFNTGVGAGTLVLNNADSNTAIGTAALLVNTAGSFNTAVGANALFSNVDGDSNVAVGESALFSNTIGINNTANGANALFSNVTGSGNTANGAGALQSNTIGVANTANGAGALLSSTFGESNTATGFQALFSNTMGNQNTADGAGALFSNDAGNANTAIGYQALFSNRAVANTAIGYQALFNNTSGNDNTAIGFEAGFNLTTEAGNVCIGSGVNGVAGERDTTRIRNVYSSVATARQVYVDSGNKIGTLSSSRRYKEEIKPMSNASRALFELKPVTFRYKKHSDPTHALSFGLIAEEVAEINSALITRDDAGNPETVRYEAINAMLLNEFLKEHKIVQEQGALIARQQKQIDALIAGLQKLSAQLELSKAGPEVAVNDP